MTTQEPSAEDEYTYLNATEQQFISDLGDMVASHEVRIEQLEQKAKEPKEPRDWISRNRTEVSWDELAGWVDWLNANYSMPDGRRVQDCWPAHPGLVHVLAGLRSAWRTAVLADEAGKEQGNAMAAFHDYHLFPFFQRQTDSTLYRCMNGHLDDVKHQVTDRRWFPEDLTAELAAEQSADSAERSAPEPEEGEGEGPEMEPLPSDSGGGSLEDDSAWWRA
ncbi:MAG: hypothetical protein ACTHYR_04210 [Brachybacterium sp.]